MIRATTGGVMRTYRSNLMKSFINMNDNRNTVLTQRTFNSFAEDPAAAARAFRLRKSRMMVESQYDICTDVHKKYETAVACLQSIDSVLCTKDGVYGQYMKTLTGTTLSMLNDPTGDAREQLTKALDQMSQEIIQAMNQKYGDNFIFAGADGHNVPFEIKDNVLYYRGVPVDAAVPNVWKDGEDFIYVTEEGEIVDDPETAAANGIQVYYLKMDKASVKTISEQDYEDLYTDPKLQTFNDITSWSENGGTKTMYAYDSNGKLVEVSKAADGSYSFSGADTNDPLVNLSDANVYYKFQDDDGNEHLISIQDYESYEQDPTQPIQYNQDGMVSSGGDYYMRIYDNNRSPKLISTQEYNETVERAKNPPALLHDSTGAVSVNESGDPNAEIGYYRIVDRSQLLTETEYNDAVTDYEKLLYLARETNFVDIGYGFQEDPVTGKLIESSAFNAALNGIDFLGYSLDEDGDPRNIYSLVQKMRSVAESVNSGTDWSAETYDEFYRLVQKFEDAVSNYQTEFVNLDASTSKLSSQKELLVDNFDNLQEQYSDIEDVDMVDAITSFIWAEYCYNAALKVGNSILSESLMDYLR